MPMRASILASVAMTAIFTGFVLNASLTLGPQARLLPLIVGIPGAGLSALQLLLDLKRTANVDREALPHMEALQWRILLWLAACIPVIVLLGFDVSTPVMVAAYHRFVQREKLVYLLASSTAAFVIVALVLDKFFGAQLYPGMLMPIVSKALRGL